MWLAKLLLKGYKIKPGELNDHQAAPSTKGSNHLADLNA